MSQDIPTHYDGQVRLAVIGGTGVSKLEGFKAVASLTIPTPWGFPSSPITILDTPSGAPVAFIARHGIHHQYTPSEVPSRANIAALRSIGVRSIIAFSAVGSLQEHIPPRDFVIPSQVIDRTKGIRPSTFFENGCVAHVGFADPFDAPLCKVVEHCCAEEKRILNGGAKVHAGKTLVCMEGPQFSTRAESRLYRSWGGDVINMSCVPESKLAREAEIAYAMVCMSTDYDCFRDNEVAVTVQEVMGNMKANAENAQRLTAAVLEELVKEEHRDVVDATSLKEGTKWAICTAPEGMNQETVAKLAFLFPEYFGPNAKK